MKCDEQESAGKFRGTITELSFDALCPPAGAAIRLRLFGTELGFRLEAADHVALESPFQTLDGEDVGPVHNIRITLGVLGLIDPF